MQTFIACAPLPCGVGHCCAFPNAPQRQSPHADHLSRRPRPAHRRARKTLRPQRAHDPLVRSAAPDSRRAARRWRTARLPRAARAMARVARAAAAQRDVDPPDARICDAGAARRCDPRATPRHAGRAPRARARRDRRAGCGGLAGGCEGRVLRAVDRDGCSSARRRDHGCGGTPQAGGKTRGPCRSHHARSTHDERAHPFGAIDRMQQAPARGRSVPGPAGARPPKARRGESLRRRDRRAPSSAARCPCTPSLRATGRRQRGRPSSRCCCTACRTWW